MYASVVCRWRTELPPGASSARCDERTRFSASSNQRPLLLRHGRLTSSIVRRSPGTARPRIGGLLRVETARILVFVALQRVGVVELRQIFLVLGHTSSSAVLADDVDERGPALPQ